MFVSLPTDDENTAEQLNESQQKVGRCSTWREANERARILFYRGKNPTIRYDEKTAAFYVRIILETTQGQTKEVPVTDSDVRIFFITKNFQNDFGLSRETSNFQLSTMSSSFLHGRKFLKPKINRKALRSIPRINRMKFRRIST